MVGKWPHTRPSAWVHLGLLLVWPDNGALLTFLASIASADGLDALLLLLPSMLLCSYCWTSALCQLSLFNTFFFTYGHIRWFLFVYFAQDVRRCYSSYLFTLNDKYGYGLSALLRPFSFNAASSFSVSVFLKTYKSEFLKVVNAKHGLIQLQYKDVIPASLRKQIEDADEEEARYLLFEHLEKYTTLDTLRAYCKVASAAGGYAPMKELGKKMMAALPA